MKVLYNLMNDRIFTSIFNDSKNKNVTARFLSDFLGLDYEYLKGNMKIKVRKRPIEIYSNPYVEFDLYVSLPDMVINVEANNRKRNEKSFAYAGKSYYENYDSKKEKVKKKVIQLNLNNYEKRGKEIEEVVPKDSVNAKYLQNFVIYEYFLPAIKELCYDEVDERTKKLISWSVILLEKDISKVEREVMKVLTKEDVPGFIEKMRKLCEEEKAEEFWENYHANVDNINHIIKTEKELSKKEGISEGKTIGKKEGLKEGKAAGLREGINKEREQIVKKMLNINLPIELIISSTGLTYEEISNIKNNVINEKIATVSDEKSNQVLVL